MSAVLFQKKRGHSCLLYTSREELLLLPHEKADKENGTAHACGHHAQLAAMLGVAIALSDEEVRGALHGNVSFFAVPAEEYIDSKKRKKLQKEGVGFPASGKSELIRTGEFDLSLIHI